MNIHQTWVVLRFFVISSVCGWVGGWVEIAVGEGNIAMQIEMHNCYCKWNLASISTPSLSVWVTFPSPCLFVLCVSSLALHSPTLFSLLKCSVNRADAIRCKRLIRSLRPGLDEASTVSPEGDIFTRRWEILFITTTSCFYYSNYYLYFTTTNTTIATALPLLISPLRHSNNRSTTTGLLLY